MKAPGNIIENFRRPLRNPYDYLSFLEYLDRNVSNELLPGLIVFQE